MQRISSCFRYPLSTARSLSLDLDQKPALMHSDAVVRPLHLDHLAAT